MTSSNISTEPAQASESGGTGIFTCDAVEPKASTSTGIHCPEPKSSNQLTQKSQPQPEKEKKKNVSFAAKSKLASSTSPGASITGQPKKSSQPRKKQTVNAANMKKENLMQLIQKKKECEKKAHEIVLRLIEPGVEKAFLLDNAIRISKQHMEDVTEERKLSEICGWVLCDNQIDSKSVPKQTYKIRGNKVYDITERKLFCSGKCYAKAVHFKSQLLTSPLWLRELEENVEFEILEDTDTLELQGISVALTSVTLSDDEESDEDEGQHDTMVERNTDRNLNDISKNNELIGTISES